MPRKFRYLIPAGTSRRLRRSEALPRSLPLARSRWKFIEVLGQDIITRCEWASERANGRERARYRRTFWKSRRGNNSGWKNGEIVSFRRKLFPVDAARLSHRYHSDGQFKVTIRRPFSCPVGRQWPRRCPDSVARMRFDGYYRIGRPFPLMEDLTCEFLRFALAPDSRSILNVACQGGPISEITKLRLKSSTDASMLR